MGTEKLEKAYSYYSKYGDKGYIGEHVSQLEHAIQAAFLAEEYSKKQIDFLENKQIYNDFVIGCFFHDIGHLLVYENETIEKMGELGVKNHEEIGADFMRSIGFNHNICEFIKNHINTKRYLITKNKSYYDNLSDASKKTFEYQGGVLNNLEISNFEKNPLLNLHIQLREFDDKAKSIDKILLDKISKLNKLDYLSTFLTN